MLPSGKIVRVTEEDDGEHADLFRALRGGCSNFGIVTRFVFRTFPQGRLWGGTLIHPLETKDQQLRAFYEFANSAAEDSDVSLMHSYGMSAERGSGCVNSVVYLKPQQETPAIVKPFVDLQPVYVNTLRALSLTELTMEQDTFNEKGLW